MSPETEVAAKPPTARAVLRGDVGAIARAISLAEDGDPAGLALLEELYPRTGSAHVVGVTGAPGVGKSTLVDQLLAAWCARGERVGVVAIDPSSPFTGGAILGDRVRMQRRACYPGVYIRSLSTRGALGGLSAATLDAVNVLDAARFGIVLVETVGAGQQEVDIVRVADTVVLVLAPGLGDDVQALKAGILEIADVLVVNKVDRPGANRTAMELRAALETAPPGDWQPPIVKCSAAENLGVGDVVAAVESHRTHLAQGGRLAQRRRRRARMELERQLEGLLAARAREMLNGSDVDARVEAIARRRASARRMAGDLLRALPDG